nr:hypothetical protein [Tanacetum cinerariifolium]
MFGYEYDLVFQFVSTKSVTGCELGLDSTVGRVVPLLPVASAHAESELESIVERLFDEGGSADQGDFAAGGGHDADIESTTGVRIIGAENVTAERPKRPRKNRQAATDASAGVAAVATLPMVTSLVSATPKHENGLPTDSIIGLNLHTLGPTERFVISSYSSHQSSTNAAGDGIDSFVRSVTPPLVMTEAVITTNVASIPSAPASETGTKVVTPVHASMFLDSDSMGTVKLAAGIHEMDYHHLFTEFNIRTARQTFLNAEVRMQTEYCLSGRRRLESECEKQADLLKVSTAEATKKMHASEIDALKQKNAALENEKGSLDGKVNDGLVGQVHELEATYSDLRGQVSGYKRLNEHIENFQDAQMNIVNNKVAKLDADLLEMALHLEEKFYPHLLNTISVQRWLLTHGLKLDVVKCLSSQKYLSAMEAAISRAIEKGMQDGLSAGIDHGKAGRNLEDVAAYNPYAEADYTSTLQRLREVDFPLFSELKSHKDASTVDVMDSLRLEGLLADALGMSDLQPNIEQLKLLIYRYEDQVILGETSLLVALDVTHSRVERIRKNVAAQRSALISVWTPLVDPLSVENLVGAASTSDSMLVTVGTIIALSITFASASTIPPITIEGYHERQPMLSRSSVEAEYHGVTNVVAETCWLRNLLRELHTPLSSAMLVYYDNFVDIFTKSLPSALFEEFRTSMSVLCSPALTAEEC